MQVTISLDVNNCFGIALLSYISQDIGSFIMPSDMKQYLYMNSLERGNLYSSTGLNNTLSFIEIKMTCPFSF